MISLRMTSCNDDEYYEMNFAPMSGLPFGVATINRESLPWQLLVAANKGIKRIILVDRVLTV